MSRLNVYANDIKNLYGFETFENIPDNVKTKLSGDLLKVLMNELGGQDFTTYLASLKDSDIAPFGSIKTHLLGDFKKESEFIDDITVFEDSVASIAVNSVWNTIFTEYKTANNLSKSLAGKKIESTYIVNGLVSGLTEELKKFMSDLDDIGLNVAVKEDKDVNYIAEYERVKDLYLKLGETVIEESPEDKRRKRLIAVTGGLKSQFVDDTLNVLKALYETGFTGFPQEGILVRNDAGDGLSSPIIKVKNGKLVSKNIDNDLGIDNDIRLENCLSSNFKVFYRTYNRASMEDDIVPHVDYFLERYAKNEPFVCPELHLAFQSGDSRFIKGKISLSNWVKEKEGMSFSEWKEKKNKNRDVLSTWKIVVDWYKWALETIFIDALMQYNKDGHQLLGDIRTESGIYKTISEALYNGIINVIVVTERDNKKYSKIELKIATRDITEENLSVVIDEEFSISESQTMDLVPIETISNFVKGFRVIYKKSEANKSQLFAGDVIDSFIDSGVVPTWGNALIGKKEDGSLFFWNGFMDPSKANPSNRCYTIYAGSRAGKGIMTSTLLASALCDNRQVFYVDGKPENGAALGRIAWEDKTEAFIFDGQPKGSEPFDGDMENFSFGTRVATDKYISLNELNKLKIFDTNSAKVFLGVMRYLKSLMLCAEIIEGRASAELPRDNWQIWVFDEMTSMSSNERTVREKFATYCASKGIKYSNGAKKGQTSCLAALSLKDLGNPDIINPESTNYDAGIKFIYDWCSWTDALMKKILKANVISLGKADTNLIFIFQEASWIANDVSATTLAKVISLIQSTKIVGRNGISPACGPYGEASTVKKKWYQKVSIDGACNWAMSSNVDIRTSDVTVFKPFNIYTVPRNPEMSDEGLPENEKLRYLKGYTKKLLSAFGKQPSEVLNSAYIYANNAINTLGLAKSFSISDAETQSRIDSVKGYIYDSVNLDYNDDEDLNSILTDTVKEMREKGLDVPIDVESGIESGTSGGSTVFSPFSVGAESDEDEKPITSTTNFGGGDTENTTPMTNVDGDTENVTNPMDSTMSENDAVDPRLEQIYERFDPAYIIVINKIVKAKENLKFIPREEKNRGKFESLQGELLRNFNGSYLSNRYKFLDEVSSKVTILELNKIVVNHYKDKFDTDYRMLKDEIQNMSFVVVKDDEETPITTPIGTSGMDEHGGNTTSSFGTDEGMGGGTATPRPKSPIEDGETRRPINSNGGQRVTSPVDTEGLTYDLNDADSLGNAKVSSKLADRVVKDILKQFGGINNIDEITLNANGCLIINGYTYTPQFGDNFVNSLGEVQKMELQQGKLTSVLNVGRVINGISLNIATLSIESPQIAYNDLFMNDLGIKKDYTSLFKSHPNLEDIYLPDEELHRHGNQQQGRSGLGLGAKLAGIFGMGRGNKDSGDYVPNPAPTYQAPPLIEKMWQSKPVRVLTGALGWTLGCKAVVFAATVFGPWGLLFGALAAAGAYKEIKNEANQTRSTYNNNNRANNGNGGNNNGGNSRSKNSNNGNRR